MYVLIVGVKSMYTAMMTFFFIVIMIGVSHLV